MKIMDMTTLLLILILLLAAVCAALLGLLLIRSRDHGMDPEKTRTLVRGELDAHSNALWRAMKDNADLQNERLEVLEKRMGQFSQTTERELEAMRRTVDEKLDETLNRRLSQSFRAVNESLDQVSQGLGEMRSLARGVGDLKKVLTNVKTRGNLGEVQLGAILEDLLAPDQYGTNVNTKGTGRERVEYAVRLPGDQGRPVWLPIDAKFPADSWLKVQDAYEAGDPEKISQARKGLAQVLRQEAKDIREKYVAPPETTDFGIMFLPSEGLYAEALRLGMSEQLQREYRVTLAGPTTMAALLNSLQTGFRTLAIKRRSGEVWETLAAVKTEFGRFAAVLRKTQSELTKANADLDQLVGARTRMMEKKLEALTAAPEEGERP